MTNAMRRPLLIIAGSILLLIGAFMARKAIGSLDRETQLSHYANLAEARHSGIIERGWVPELLPAGSTDITEIHDLDANTGTGTFRFPSADLDAFKAQARRFAGADVKEAYTITYVVYSRDRSRFELVLTPDPKTAEAMIGVWNMKPVR